LEPRLNRHLISGRRFALISISYKYLDVGISVGPVCTVVIRICDNRGNHISMSDRTWEKFIARRADIERLTQDGIPVEIHDLIVKVVKKIRDENIIKCHRMIIVRI